MKAYSVVEMLFSASFLVALVESRGLNKSSSSDACVSTTLRLVNTKVRIFVLICVFCFDLGAVIEHWHRHQPALFFLLIVSDFV